MVTALSTIFGEIRFDPGGLRTTMFSNLTQNVEMHFIKENVSQFQTIKTEVLVFHFTQKNGITVEIECHRELSCIIED